jgi:hypothetical protein
VSPTLADHDTMSCSARPISSNGDKITPAGDAMSPAVSTSCRRSSTMPPVRCQ